MNDWILRLMDVAVGWLLWLPTDAVLFAVAIGTGAILTLARRFTTDQDLLRRCAEDKKRLNELIREARQRGDVESVKRCKATKSRIAAKSAKSEGKPLLVALLPIALLGTWALQRLAWHPPRAGEPVQLNAYFPITAAGQVAHLAPEEGVVCENGWIQEIRAVSGNGPAHGLASWTVRAAMRPTAYELQIRYKGGTWRQPLLVGRRTYAPPVIFHKGESVECTEVKLREVRLFGLIPGIPALYLPAWLVAYFLIAIPSVSLLKRVLRIY